MKMPRRLSLLALAALVPLASCSQMSLFADDGDCVAVGGQFDAHAPGYLVMYRSGVPAAETTDALAARYGFAVTSRYDAVGGFYAASLTNAQVDGLRCEPVVGVVEHNSIVTIDD